MGYTHYWQQPLRYTNTAWKQICEDITAILNDVQHVQGIPLGDGHGEPGTAPEITAERIFFNGIGDDSHETFSAERSVPPLTEQEKSYDFTRGGGFCKTARKPYDVAVTACLAYFASLEKKPWDASSDGYGHEWLEGVELARRCVPRLANQIDIPLGVRRSDRWRGGARYEIGTSHNSSHKYQIGPCLDGRVYVFERANEQKAYCFPTYDEAKAYFASFKEKRIKVKSSWQPGGVGWEGGQPLFNTSGSYDSNRHAKLRQQQDRVLRALIECAEAEGRNIPPPAYARPNAMAAVAREQEDLADLYSLCS